MKISEFRKLIREEVRKVIKEETSQDIISFLETNGFVKIKNKEEYLKIIPILAQAGYSLVGGKFPLNPTPFDIGYGSYDGKPGSSGRKKERKNSIYLMRYWDEDKSGKYNKYLWLADYLDKNKINDKFPIGTPNAY